MQTFTYSGETPAQALKKAHDELGDDVLIINTKEVRKKTLNQSALYELVVGIEDSSHNGGAKSANSDNPKEPETLLPDNSIQKRLDEIARKEIEQKKRQRSLSHLFDDDVTIQLSSAVREISTLTGVSTSMPDLSTMKPHKTTQKAQANTPTTSTPHSAPTSLSTSAHSSHIPYGGVESIPPSTPQATQDSSKLDSSPAVESSSQKETKRSTNTFAPSDDTQNIKELQNEVKKINDRLKLIQNTLWEEKAPRNMGVEIPKEFAEIYRIAKSSGMNKAHLEEIMRLSLEFMPLKMREQSQTIRRYFREVLRKMIYCRKENSVGKKIIMLVGPTGVGKTTTLAKLAARYSQIVEPKKKVGIITLDDYRIGAMEQLAWYARKMRLSIDSVSESDDFINKIEALNYCDYILIDTAGHSQHDQEKINELKRFIRNDDYKIDVTLVLSASTKYEDLKDAYNAFGALGIDTFIFSKLDEAKGLGNVFSLVYETKKPISYLSIGQEVPSDVIVADNMYLADCLIGGFFYPERIQETR